MCVRISGRSRCRSMEKLENILSTQRGENKVEKRTCTPRCKLVLHQFSTCSLKRTNKRFGSPLKFMHISYLEALSSHSLKIFSTHFGISLPGCLHSFIESIFSAARYPCFALIQISTIYCGGIFSLALFVIVTKYKWPGLKIQHRCAIAVLKCSWWILLPI